MKHNMEHRSACLLKFRAHHAWLSSSLPTIILQRDRRVPEISRLGPRVPLGIPCSRTEECYKQRLGLNWLYRPGQARTTTKSCTDGSGSASPKARSVKSTWPYAVLRNDGETRGCNCSCCSCLCVLMLAKGSFSPPLEALCTQLAETPENSGFTHVVVLYLML